MEVGEGKAGKQVMGRTLWRPRRSGSKFLGGSEGEQQENYDQNRCQALSVEGVVRGLVWGSLSARRSFYFSRIACIPDVVLNFQIIPDFTN